ncbi:MAG: DUF4954 family protein [Saprospiraceae bacterium]
MNDIQKKPIEHIGYDFVADGSQREVDIDAGKRDLQKQWPYTFRPLEPVEIEILVQQKNTASDWGHIWVAEGFDPRLVRNNRFFGLVRIGPLHPVYLEFHDLNLPVGIYNSTLISCDLGEDVAIMNVSYLAHYLIEPSVILLNIDEMHVTDHAKFGEGVLKDGETEAVRVWMEVMNENGRRSILPFVGMTPFDAWLWARYRGDASMLDKLKCWTQQQVGSDRGAYGVVGTQTVIKSCRIIKDVRIGSHAYIKGANKLKNLTISSEAHRPSQIGEGVEMVNGIMGFGCRAFYGVKAIRFIMDDHTTLKYGARLINSYLGANSTISCCEVLNSLIFPFHEQHHNNSFLIAGLIEGQSNIASGATLGSNHNTRQADGEFIAKRGFWPGLCVSIKHNSLFASYTLLVKGDYPFEINNPFPFALVANDVSRDELSIMPAYWWMYNTYALFRNEHKYQSRERRQNLPGQTDTSFLAPDTVQEIRKALKLLTELPLEGDGLARIPAGQVENSKRTVRILKVTNAIRAYREMLLYFAAKSLLEGEKDGLFAVEDYGHGQEVTWINGGGLLLTDHQITSLIRRIGQNEIASWSDLHETIDGFGQDYPFLKVRLAREILNELEFRSTDQFAGEYLNLLDELKSKIQDSRRKDFENPFRKATSMSEEEWNAVYGSVADEDLLIEILHKFDAAISQVNHPAKATH